MREKNVLTTTTIKSDYWNCAVQYNTILATVLNFRQPTTTFSYIYVSVLLMLYTMQEGTVQSSP